MVSWLNTKSSRLKIFSMKYTWYHCNSSLKMSLRFLKNACVCWSIRVGNCYYQKIHEHTSKQLSLFYLHRKSSKLTWVDSLIENSQDRCLMNFWKFQACSSKGLGALFLLVSGVRTRIFLSLSCKSKGLPLWTWKQVHQLWKGDIVPYEFENLWRTRNIIWNFVDRRIARIYKLPSLAVNISLPSPPIGDQIPTVPDAPWMASNLDLDLLIKEEIGFGCPRNFQQSWLQNFYLLVEKSYNNLLSYDFLVLETSGLNHKLSNTCPWKAWTGQYKNFISWMNVCIIFARDDQFFPRFCLKIIRRFKYICCSFSSMPGSLGLESIKCSKSFFTFEAVIPCNNLMDLD